MGSDALEPQQPSEVLTPDAVFLAGEGGEGRGVNADEAYPGLQSVNLRGAARRRGGGRRGGMGQQTAKEREERGRNR
ncbi:hypothetical protein GCM10009630_44880 [Kribbella jejuensis]|uniref:Uncharacterized protein n=1 Tax=Kribbella jejuensis TaxID=236068 RepID=A0A542EMW0_9ACTN|nr:hypothetical protein [Kribbella jejuensis]TQJ16683.1 hypothetical protein FB475_0788 [Kribbella jejuensis]